MNLHRGKHPAANRPFIVGHWDADVRTRPPLIILRLHEDPGAPVRSGESAWLVLTPEEAFKLCEVLRTAAVAQFGRPAPVRLEGTVEK